MTVQEELRALIERNYLKLCEQLEAVTRLLVERDPEAPFDQALIAAAQSLTHQLRGSAGTIGFSRLSAAAAELDESLSRLMFDQSPVAADRLEGCLGLLIALRSIAAQTTPDMSALYRADLPSMVPPAQCHAA